MNAKGSGVDRTLRARRVWRGARFVLLALVVAYITLVIYRIPAVREEKLSQAAVAQIEAQKLTMQDIDGSHLPPPPEPREADATLAGIDENGNGIRDDVELAIFAEYPTSSATSTALRAAELQYAIELQNELTNVFDSATWVATAKSENNGISCLVDVAFKEYSNTADQIHNSDEWEQEVENLVFNTTERKAREKQVDEAYQTSFAVGSGECDLDLNTLQN